MKIANIIITIAIILFVICINLLDLTKEERKKAIICFTIFLILDVIYINLPDSLREKVGVFFEIILDD